MIKDNLLAGTVTQGNSFYRKSIKLQYKDKTVFGSKISEALKIKPVVYSWHFTGIQQTLNYNKVFVSQRLATA